MQTTRSRIQYLPMTILIVVGVLFWVLSCGHIAAAGVYADSAHGDTIEGVNRSTATCENWPGEECVTGSCAHCHDTFDPSICGDDLNHPNMLFSTPLYTQQNIGFCLECHKAPSIPEQVKSVQVNMPNQRSYSYKFGGDTDTCPHHIKQAFNFVKEGGNSRSGVCSSNNGSAHHLTSIRNFLQGRWGFGDALDKINPCEGCHNPHKAQQHDYPIGSDGTSPISLPSTHEIWGDQTTERMDSYASPDIYQAPRYYFMADGYEPDGGIQQNGANVPDYVTFCTDCHNSSNDIWSTQLGRYLHKFDWATEKHGRGAATDDDYEDFYWYGGPYLDSQAGSYVMSCMDCHEAHGSSNSYLARATVNGGSADLTRGDVNPWGNWCRRCHARISHNPGPHTSLRNQGWCTQCHPVILDPTGEVGIGDTCDCHYHGAGPGVGGL